MKSEVIRVRVNPEMKMRLLEIADMTKTNVSSVIKAGIQHLMNLIYDERGYPSRIKQMKGGKSHVNDVKD